MDMESNNTFSTDHQISYFQFDQQQFPPPPYSHSLRNFPARNVITKKPIAPLPPTPPKIYKVDPVDFKDVVQKLTGAQEFLPTRLQEVAPPPLDLAPPPPLHHNFRGIQEGEKQLISTYEHTGFGALSPLGFNLSPASIAWCSTMLMSPGTVAALGPSAAF